MIEPFRYIEHEFAIPSDGTGAIALSDGTDFQKQLSADAQRQNAAALLRDDANSLIGSGSGQPGAVKLGDRYIEFCRLALLENPVSNEVLSALVSKEFGSTETGLSTSDAFQSDKHLLNDLLIAVKIVTGFDRVRADQLVTMRQCINFIEVLAAKRVTVASTADLRKALFLPVQVPTAFLVKPLPDAPPPAPQPSPADNSAQQLESLRKEHNDLKFSYEKLLSLRADQLQMVHPAGVAGTGVLGGPVVTARAERLIHATPAGQLTLRPATASQLGDVVKRTLEKSSLSMESAPLTRIIAAIKSRWQEVSDVVEPHNLLPITKGLSTRSQPFRPERPCARSFTARETRPKSHCPPPGRSWKPPDREARIARFEAGEVSRIENVLQGELLRRVTCRSDENEVTTTDETQTTQTDERDLESTDRNEMVSETQKEAGQQSQSSKDQTSTTSYGKLVENNKSNYAKTVTDRAVSSLTQQVKHQRVEREKRQFSEKVRHEYDNKGGAKNVTGIYQWSLRAGAAVRKPSMDWHTSVFSSFLGSDRRDRHDLDIVHKESYFTLQFGDRNVQLARASSRGGSTRRFSQTTELSVSRNLRPIFGACPGWSR